MTVAGATLSLAFAECERITRTQARNFSYGIRLLAPAQRQAMSAVYALSRRIDDIGDGALPTPERLRALGEVRTGVATMTPQDSDPVLAAVAETARVFPLPVSAFGDLIDGVESDVHGSAVPDFDALVRYCRQVAGSVGRLSLGIYGNTDPQAHALADDLGVALQQTNILRDVREDLGNGRTYLPADELAAAGIELRTDPRGRLGGPEPALTTLLSATGRRAEGWYDAGRRLLPQLDRRSGACTAAMAGIYYRLNTIITADPAVVLTQRISLPATGKLAAAARALLWNRL